jgi:rRNA maturation endonuclease Nob1
MKGLDMLGRVISNTLNVKLSHKRQKEIRRTINPERICDWCLKDYSRQTREGHKLCSRCFIEYGNNIKK